MSYLSDSSLLQRFAYLKDSPRNWLVSGCAGFIGSNLTELLLLLDQRVIGLDNFSTGTKNNLAAVQAAVGPNRWGNFTLISGDITDPEVCYTACTNIDHVLHQAALGSIPRSIDDPVRSNHVNVSGFLNMLTAAKDREVNSFIYASSSSVYGDSLLLPKVETKIGSPLSPYALTKLINEQYATVFGKTYHFGTTGLRYFNVFGPRQDPYGPYAAVIPKWLAAARKGSPLTIHGDGSSSRDFCYVENVLQANLLSSVKEQAKSARIFNVACGQATNLLHLASAVSQYFNDEFSGHEIKTEFTDFRLGDVKHSLANIELIKAELGYIPEINFELGLAKTISWYCK